LLQLVKHLKRVPFFSRKAGSMRLKNAQIGILPSFDG
jgi:hypothetical protein